MPTTDEQVRKIIRRIYAEARGCELKLIWKDAELFSVLLQLLPASDPLAAEIRAVGRDYDGDFDEVEFEDWSARLEEVRVAARKRVC